MAEGGSTEELLNTIGDRTARRVLATIDREPRSAKEIAARLDLSLPTVYRRLDTLTEHDLVTDRTRMTDEGNHYKVYDCTFESTVVSLHSGEYEVRVFRADNVPDRFRRLWEELSGGTSS